MSPPQTLELLNELRSTLGKMEVALGAIAEAIAWADDRGNVQWCNQAFDHLVGKSHILALGADLVELLPLRQGGLPIARASHPLTACLEQGKVSDEQYEFSSGTEARVLQISAARVEGIGQSPTVILVIHDVTARARAEAALKRETMFARLLQEVATAANEAASVEEALQAGVDRVCALTRWPVGHVYVASDEDPELMVPSEIWHLDGAFEELCRATRATSLRRGQGLPGRVLASGQAAWIEDIAVDANFPRQTVARNLGVRAAFGFPVQIGKETVAVMEFFSTHIEAPDQQLLAVMVDVGHQMGRVIERKRVEHHLQSARLAALEVARLKSDFLATMSHEIRTPLNGVIGATGLLLDAGLSREQREYAEMAHASAESLLALVNDILDVSKIESGKLVIEPIPFDLEVAAAEVLDMLSLRAEAKAIQLMLRYLPSVPRRVVGDAGRIRQILTNLVSNAIKFTDKGHVLTEIWCDRVSNGVGAFRFSIEDTGIGIPAESRGGLFEKFVQADASTTRRYGGTGLGLAISKQLVEVMGGAIGIESREGQGSTFWFTLPLSLATDHPIVPEPAESLADVRVLIVDDNQTNRRILQEQVSSWAMVPAAVASGGEAMEALRGAVARGAPFQMALLDYNMPEMDGEGLARQIKVDHALRDTVLLLLTSAGRRGDSARMAEAGFAAYLTKPVRPSMLLDALRTAWAAHHLGRQSPLITRHSLKERDVEPAPPAREAAAPRARVLLVEDNIVNQKLARRLLEKLGCRVDCAANGKEAVDMVGRLPYDVVFMDCQMPEMDGYDATREIRRRENGKHVPIVAMTAHAFAGDREKCLRAGMDDYLTKPIDRDTLGRALERWLKPASAPAGIVADAAPVGAAADFECDVTEALRSLLDGIGEESVAVIAALLERSREQIRSLRPALAASDWKLMKVAAHDLRGTTGMIGARAIVTLSSALEAAIRDSLFGEVPKMVDGLERLFGELAPVVTRELSRVRAKQP